MNSESKEADELIMKIEEDKETPKKYDKKISDNIITTTPFKSSGLLSPTPSSPKRISPKTSSPKKLSEITIIPNEKPKPDKPLEFMDKMYNPNSNYFKKEEFESIFKSLKQEELLKSENFINFSIKKTLSGRFKGKSKTSICLQGDQLIVGELEGIIRLCNLSDESEKKNISISTVEKIKSTPGELNKVNSLNISPTGKYLLAGHESGHCVIWELPEGKYYFHLNKSGEKNPVKTAKFIAEYKHKLSYRLEFIVTYNSGLALKIVVEKTEKGEMKKAIEEIRKEEQDQPFFYINEVYRYKHNKAQETAIVALGNYKQINIYKFVIGLPHTLITEIKRNGENFRGSFNSPDISFGFGELPKREFAREEVSKNKLKTCATMELYKDYGNISMTTPVKPINRTSTELMYKYKDFGKPGEKKFMIAINWERTLRIYILDLKTWSCTEDAVCHFLNPKSKIIRLGFITDSFLYMIDQNKTLKVISTGRLVYGRDPRSGINPEEEERIYHKCVVGIQSIQEQNIYAEQIKEKIFCYRGFIFRDDSFNTNCANTSIYFLSSKCFFKEKIMDYEEFLNDLTVINDWDNAMKIGLAAYQGKIFCLPGVSINDSASKAKYLSFLKNLIMSYIDYGITQELIHESTHKVIDLCIHLEQMNFLFSDILQIFESKGKTDVFWGQFEPFIFQGYLKQRENQLSETALISMIMSYRSQKKEIMLSLLLNNMHPDIFKSKPIKSLCEKFKIFQPYINFSSKSEKIKVIQEMFKEFLDRHYVNSGKVVKYPELIKDEGLEHLNKIREFLGHQILWNVNKMIYDLDYENDSDHLIIAKLFIWLLSSDPYVEFCKFDSFSYYEILSQFFLNRGCLSSVQLIDYDKKELKDFIHKYPPFKEFKNLIYNNSANVILYLDFASKNVSSFYHLLDHHLFMLKLASLHINKRNLASVFYQSANYIMKTSSNILNLKQEELFDKFACHYFCDELFLLRNDFIEYASQLLKFFVAKFPFEQFEKELKKNSINEEQSANALLMTAQGSPFTLVYTKLLERQKKYEKCLDIYLKHPELFQEHFIFEYIKQTFKTLREKNPKTNEIDYKRYDEFYDKVLHILGALANLNKAETKRIMDYFYKKENKINIVRQMYSAPDIQLELIEIILKDQLKASSSLTFSDIEFVSDDDLEDILKLHIKLLIEQNHQSRILYWLKRGLPYPLEDILGILLKNDVIDACVFIYQKLSKNNMALNLVLNRVKELFYQITEEKSRNNETIEEFKKYVEKCKNVCQYACEQEQVEIFNAKDKESKTALQKIQSDNEELWFTLMKNLYNFQEEIEKDAENRKKDDNKSNVNLSTTPTPQGEVSEFTLNESAKTNKGDNSNYSEDFREVMLEILKTLFTKMCKYIHILKIIEKSESFSGIQNQSEFAKNIYDMIHLSCVFETILVSGKFVFENDLINSFGNLLDNRNAGNQYSFSKCDFCNKKFLKAVEDEKIVVFKCGHKVHLWCVHRNDKGELFCKKCKQIEMEEYGDEDIKELAEKKSGHEDNEDPIEVNKRYDLTRKEIRRDFIKKIRINNSRYVELFGYLEKKES